MNFLVPALVSYIAYGMADRPGIAPGFTVGAVALSMDAYFIGGIVGGVLVTRSPQGSGSWTFPAGLPTSCPS